MWGRGDGCAVEEWVGKGGDFLRDYMIISKIIKFVSQI